MYREPVKIYPSKVLCTECESYLSLIKGKGVVYSEIKTSFPMESVILNLRIEDGFAIVTMTNWENRLNQKFVNAFNNALDEVERNNTCKALITVGEGKFFSNGLDLTWMDSQERNIVRNFMRDLSALTSRIRNFPLPTVAACNGHTFAGGALLALAHDYSVMNSERGWMCWNEVHLKKKFDSNALKAINMKIHRKDVIRDAIVFGKRFTAQEANGKGLVDEVAKPENLISTAKSLTLKALGKDGLGRQILQKMKEDLWASMDNYPVNARL